MVMVSPQSSRTLTKTEVSTREQCIVVTDLTVFLVHRMWTLGLGLEKQLNDLNEGWWAILEGGWKTVVLRTM